MKENNSKSYIAQFHIFIHICLTVSSNVKPQSGTPEMALS